MSHSPTTHLRRIRDLVDARLKATGHYYFGTGIRRFLDYLQTEFPQLSQLSELRRDPHLLGFLRCLAQQQPPLSRATRRTYLASLRCVFRDLASQGHSMAPELILPEDVARVPRPQLLRTTIFPRPLPPHIFDEIFQTHIQTLATTLRPKTLHHYRSAVRHFLFYLQTEFPELQQLSELRRDPHLFGYFRYLCQIHPRAPLSNYTRQQYLIDLRVLLEDLAAAGHLLAPGLIRTQDLPILPQLLPRALSPDDDLRLQQELRRTDDLNCNALLLMRATGIRSGECIDLAADCLRPIGPDQWALHVPLGKLHTERLLPIDTTIQQLLTRIRELRATAPPSHLSAGWLLPRAGSADTVYRVLCQALADAAKRAGCSQHITCHQLRHTFATELINLRISLPALMRLLGHKHINMTMRYLRITQEDVLREFHLAIQNRVQRHTLPQLAVPDTAALHPSGIPGIRQALEAIRYWLEMYRRQLQDGNARHKLQRLEIRISRVASELDSFKPTKK